MRARNSLVLVLATVALGILPLQAQAQTQASSASTPSSGPATEVHLFAPFTVQGLNSDLKVTGRVSGDCSAPSLVDVNRADAWACTVAFKTFDPCFANADMTQLACPDLPNVANPTISEDSLLSVTLVTSTEPLDPTQANTPAPDPTPFLIELTDGEFCVPEPADVVYASLPVFGWCGSGYWFGPGDLSQALWTLPILQGGSSPSLSTLINIGILRLWY